MKKLRKGFTLVEILLVVAIIGILAAVIIPKILIAKERSRAMTCQENLRDLDNAKEQWALEGRLPTGTIVHSDMLSKICGPENVPVCPSGGTYHPNNIGVDPTCSIGTTISQEDDSVHHVISWE